MARYPDDDQPSDVRVSTFCASRPRHAPCRKWLTSGKRTIRGSSASNRTPDGKLPSLMPETTTKVRQIRSSTLQRQNHHHLPAISVIFADGSPGARVSRIWLSTGSDCARPCVAPAKVRFSIIADRRGKSNLFAQMRRGSPVGWRQETPAPHQ